MASLQTLQERDHIANGIGAAEQHDQPVQPEGDPPVRRRPELQRLEQESDATVTATERLVALLGVGGVLLGAVLALLLGRGISGYISYELLQRNARDEVLRTAGVMMEAALSMRSYTVAHVRPNPRTGEDEFLPQSVPAYAATEIMSLLRKKYPDMSDEERLLRYSFAGTQVDDMLAANTPMTDYVFKTPVMRLLEELTRRKAARVYISRPDLTIDLRS